MKKRIGIDARLISQSGIGRYINNLLINIAKIDMKNEYFVFLLRKDLDKISLPENFSKIEANISWYSLKEQTALPKILNKYNLDLVHFPHFNVPIFYKRNFVVTVHDLIHQHFQMRKASTLDPLTYKIKQLGYKQVFKNAINKSLKIIVPSNYVKKLLMMEWKVKDEKIIVTYEAADDRIFAGPGFKPKINFPYIFYIGNAHPHKNVEGLIEAFLQLKKDSSAEELKLVLAGKDHYFWKRIKDKYTDENIKYVGFITDSELASYYKGARCYVLPSLEEGFGIPMLEAFAGKCPVAASNIGALREIVKDAALYFDPKNIENMSQTIKKILDDKELRKKLIEKGSVRCKEFSWKKLTEKTLEVYAGSYCS